VPVPDLAAELLELLAPAAERLGSGALVARIDPSRCEADLQLEAASPQEAAAGLVARSLA
jgi:hypothetical protein